MNRYYDRYGITSPQYMVIRRGGENLRQYASKYFKGKLLDIGCGTKAKSHLIGDAVGEYVGLDHKESLHDQSMVDIFSTAYEIPGPDAAYDSILCTAVLEHLEEPERALKEAYRVLKPGGYAVYTVPFFWHLHEEPRDYYRYSKYGLKYLFEKAGFEVIELKALSGFWLTFGSEWNYYLHLFAFGPFRYIVSAVITVNNIIFPLLDKIDMKCNSLSEKWTWLNIVVVKKK